MIQHSNMKLLESYLWHQVSLHEDPVFLDRLRMPERWNDKTKMKIQVNSEELTSLILKNYETASQAFCNLKIERIFLFLLTSRLLKKMKLFMHFGI